MIDEEVKMQRKVDRITKQIIDIKNQISNLQDNLQLRFDKLRDLGIEENEVDGFGKIAQVTSTRKNYDIKGLAEEVGQNIIDKYTSISESTFYRVNIDKKFYER
jgi:hypothetical protein